MATIAKSVTVPTAPAAVWSVVGAVESIAAWHPGVVASESLDGGKRRTCTFPNGMCIEEAILERDDAAMRYVYTIVGDPLPVRGYRSTLSVTPAPDGGSTVTGAAEYEPAADPAEVAAMLDQVYSAGMTGLQATFAR